jgi:hypothetical protein
MAKGIWERKLCSDTHPYFHEPLLRLKKCIFTFFIPRFCRFFRDISSLWLIEARHLHSFRFPHATSKNSVENFWSCLTNAFFINKLLKMFDGMGSNPSDCDSDPSHKKAQSSYRRICFKICKFSDIVILKYLIWLDHEKDNYILHFLPWNDAENHRVVWSRKYASTSSVILSQRALHCCAEFHVSQTIVHISRSRPRSTKSILVRGYQNSDSRRVNVGFPLQYCDCG